MSEQAATEQDVLAVAQRAREAAVEVGPLPRGAKDAALHVMADALDAATADVLSANERDLAAGRESGMNAGLLDRLALTDERVAAMAQGLRDVAALPDPVGEVLRGYTRPTAWRSGRSGCPSASSR